MYYKRANHTFVFALFDFAKRNPAFLSIYYLLLFLVHHHPYQKLFFSYLLADHFSCHLLFMEKL
jgi:hypothetical protein